MSKNQIAAKAVKANQAEILRVMSAKDLADIAGEIRVAEDLMLLHVQTRTESYKTAMAHIIKGIPSGLGANKAAYEEYSRRLKIVSEKVAAVLPVAERPARAKVVRDYLVRIGKEALGFKQPVMPVSEDEKARKDAAARKARSRAMAAAKAALPKATDEALIEKAKEILKENSEDAKEAKRLNAVSIRAGKALQSATQALALFEDCMDAALQSEANTIAAQITALEAKLNALAEACLLND